MIGGGWVAGVSNRHHFRADSGIHKGCWTVVQALRGLQAPECTMSSAPDVHCCFNAVSGVCLVSTTKIIAQVQIADRS